MVYKPYSLNHGAPQLKVLFTSVVLIQQSRHFFPQVLAAELTTGYETMANLQLFKVNGIPILNLKHLASVLDDITRPFSKDGDSHNSAAKTEITVTTDSCLKASPLPKQNEVTVKSSAANPRQNDNIIPLKEISQGMDESDSRSCAKLKTLEDVKKDVERGSSVCDSDVDSLSEDRTSSTDPRKQDFVKSDSCARDSFFSSTQTAEENSGVDQDPTLLNREDFVHFELDKDKIIVLHIPTAYMAAPEILRQYAIGQSRSDDLPTPP